MKKVDLRKLLESRENKTTEAVKPAESPKKASKKANKKKGDE